VADPVTLLLGGLACAAMATVVVWAVRPLFGPVAGPRPPDPRAAALLARREALLAALRDLDADVGDGRIAQADYPSIRADLVRRGAEVLAALDDLSERPAGCSPLPAAAAAPVEAAPAAEALVADEAVSACCRACDQDLAPGDRFCRRCGAAVTPGDREPA
jgi:hypothetical protein